MSSGWCLLGLGDVGDGTLLVLGTRSSRQGEAMSSICRLPGGGGVVAGDFRGQH